MKESCVVVPVYLSPDHRTVPVAYLTLGPLDVLADERCPVCTEFLGESAVALVHIGRYPANGRGPWVAAAVAVHATCSDAEGVGYVQAY